MTINYQQPWGQFGPGIPVNPFGAQAGQSFPGMNVPFFPQQFPQGPVGGAQFFEQSFIENILRLNRGKTAVVYMNFEGSQWGSKIFKGEILEAGRDHLILRDNQTNTTYLLLMIYLSYVTFEGDIDYIRF
ncbi:MAG: spore coat protein GerQ [Bacilli bacterium]|jgi:spore germination protein Q|nr:spore coat protein GerQ [Acholeplasmataceae bacterium]OQB63984.1 MAG: Spore coat protein GerQ [Tenericutes bacterium ADurb.Bin140]